MGVAGAVPTHPRAPRRTSLPCARALHGCANPPPCTPPRRAATASASCRPPFGAASRSCWCCHRCCGCPYWCTSPRARPAGGPRRAGWAGGVRGVLVRGALVPRSALHPATPLWYRLCLPACPLSGPARRRCHPPAQFWAPRLCGHPAVRRAAQQDQGGEAAQGGTPAVQRVQPLRPAAAQVAGQAQRGQGRAAGLAAPEAASLQIASHLKTAGQPAGGASCDMAGGHCKLLFLQQRNHVLRRCLPAPAPPAPAPLSCPTAPPPRRCPAPAAPA